ncbi:hypothetical protein K458DRAFT_410209 [Lentithecium fluviatile CBS 122367]|uniref:Uncharacterized protein n=1 Tax=Lentithecium fluviatile CBS 122367 TaxID=1168545 RepID=A0A6G1IES5_9PLEO|nr:hypothetical protein K458DRAFT_410209 [Lentithecium fluviatile CBS 122367]
MPPKKAAAGKAAATSPVLDAGGEVKFTWTPENERLLLLLAARSSIGRADYTEFLKAMPTNTRSPSAGCTFEGLRQKFQKMRREQREIYDKMGWVLNDSCPAPANAANAANTSKDGETTEKLQKAAKGKKRAAAGDADAGAGAEGEQAAEKPVKKAKGRGRPKKARAAKADEVEEGDGLTNDLTPGGVKEASDEV